MAGWHGAVPGDSIAGGFTHRHQLTVCARLQSCAHVLVQHAAESAFDKECFLHGYGWRRALGSPLKDGMLIRWVFLAALSSLSSWS